MPEGVRQRLERHSLTETLIAAGGCSRVDAIRQSSWGARVGKGRSG